MERLRLVAASAAFVLLLVCFWPVAVLALVIDACFGGDDQNYYHRL